MAGDDPTRAVARTVRLYPWYALAFNAYCWMPVFVLYFLEHMTLAEVLRLEAIYYASVVVLEVPSGYFSDRVGRRPTLLIATACLVAAYVTFFVGHSFAVFALAQVLLAAGLAFNSGTDTSLHYDSLASLGRESEYDAREAVAARNSLLSSGIAALMGGAVGLLDLRFAYGLSAVAAAAALLLVVRMKEPPKHERMLVAEGPARQIRACSHLLADRLLRWTFAYAVVMTVLNHVPYEFYQPYIEYVLTDVEWLLEGTPLASGVHAGVVMILASLVAGASIALRDRFGYTRTLLGSTALQVLIILAMGVVLHPLILLLVLLRSVPRAVATAPINAAIAPRVGRAQRATFLSIQSLTGRLGFAGYLVLISLVSVPSSQGDDWSAFSWRLITSAAVGMLALLALAASSSREISADTH